MIQRYTICSPKKLLSIRFEAGVLVPYKPNYNAASGNLLPVITDKHPDRFSLLQWGLVPFDSKDSQIADKLLNARIETIKGKQPFADLLPNNRCLILADSFYIWKEVHGVKTPYRVTMKDESLFAIAGIWDEWKMEESDESRLFGSFSMITIAANKAIASYQDRMPAIVPKEHESNWLKRITETSEEELISLITPIDESLLKIYKVDTHVNNTEINGAKVIREANSTSTGFTLSLFD